jgi:hypothetical protein
LLAWARENGRLIETASYLKLLEDQGEEHRVWLDVPSQRYFKTTHAGRFGFIVVAMPDGTLELTSGTPLEYLERLLLQNALFGDSVQLEGVATEENGTVILTSQPNIEGSPITADDMLTFMSKLWFQPLRGLSLGRPGALAFYRDLDEIAAFDAHPGNFVKDESGIVLPIDLVLLRATDELQQAFKPFLG